MSDQQFKDLTRTLIATEAMLAADPLQQAKIKRGDKALIKSLTLKLGRKIADLDNEMQGKELAEHFDKSKYNARLDRMLQRQFNVSLQTMIGNWRSVSDASVLIIEPSEPLKTQKF